MKKDKAKLLEQIKHSRWVEWGTRRVTTRLAENWVGGSANFSKFFGLKFPDQLQLLRNEVAFCYFEAEQFEKFKKELLDKFLTKGFKNFYLRKAKPYFHSTLEFCKKIAGLKLKNYSNERLLDIYHKFIEREDLYINILWAVFCLDFCLPEVFEAELKRHLEFLGKGREFEKYLKSILYPSKKSDAIEQNYDMIRLALKIGDDSRSKLAQAELNKLVKKYSYFPFTNFDEQPFGRDHFENEIKKFQAEGRANLKQKLKQTKIDGKFNRKEYRRIIREIGRNRKLRVLTEACHEIAFYRDYRNEIRRKYSFYISSLYKEIAERFNVPINFILMMTREEIGGSLKNNLLAVNYAEIDERKTGGYAIASINHRLLYYLDSNIYDELITRNQSQLLEREFQGVKVGSGRATGIAKLIISIKTDGHKFNQGDILVTSMTNVDFVSLMSKAAAIITDEGGQLCHAAIISRELGIPCIVGTKIATKVLKDGDYVEVNADEGVVKVVKRDTKGIQ